MARVKALDPHLINVIAAGEVIERPASILKELIENSLDSNATRLEVEVEGGGVRLARVSDDGDGMERNDLELAVQRHTTSKISSEADLEAIRTLGFRGEALASICEVARVRIRSRPAHADEGHELSIEGGTVRALEPAGRAVGTTVEVRDLFYNVPARRKFLKREQTESIHITRAVKRFLFSHPDVHLKLTQNGKTTIDSPRTDDLREVAAHLYGPQVAKSVVSVDFQGEVLRVWGWASTAQQSRADRNEQYTFVNRRAVSDAALNYALGRAYRGALEPGRYPYVCLHLELDPRLVDVNVHPQKHEVRFLDAQGVKRELIRALSESLVSTHATPNLPWKQAESALRYKPTRPEGGLDLAEELKQRSLEPTRAERPAAPTSQPSPPPVPQKSELVTTPDYQVVGQIHGTYIVLQTAAGFELIDQHVAAERVLYERFLKQLSQGGVRPQKLLIPETLELSPDAAQALNDHQEALNKLGIELEAFGPDTFLLRAWPQSLAEHHASAGYQDTLERLLETVEQEGEPDFETLAKTLVASLACEAAVVKHTLLPLEAMRHLVKGLKAAQDPYHCPHGRPVILKYDLGQLERAFKRR